MEKCQLAIIRINDFDEHFLTDLRHQSRYSTSATTNIVVPHPTIYGWR